MQTNPLCILVHCACSAFQPVAHVVRFNQLCMLHKVETIVPLHPCMHPKLKHPTRACSIAGGEEVYLTFGAEYLIFFSQAEDKLP